MAASSKEVGVGVAFNQEAADTLEHGDLVQLVPKPHRKDPSAVQIQTADGRTVAFVARERTGPYLGRAVTRGKFLYHYQDEDTGAARIMVAILPD